MNKYSIHTEEVNQYVFEELELDYNQKQQQEEQFQFSIFIERNGFIIQDTKENYR